VLIATKVELPDAEPEELERKMAESLRASMDGLRVDHIDLFLLHSQLQPDDGPTAPRLLSVGCSRGGAAGVRAADGGGRDPRLGPHRRRPPRALHDVLPELATVVLGVENRAELEECPAAEAAGPLSDDELRAIAAAGRGASARRPAGERRLATQRFHRAAERNPSWVFSYERIG
jgi:hypothetical protein